MLKIRFDDLTYSCRQEETLLDALLRQGKNIPFSCRSGVCHTCMMVAVRGEIPAAAQKGLSDEQRGAGCFLPCKCRPTADLDIAQCKAQGRHGEAAEKPSSQGDEAPFPPPAPELWLALEEGRVLKRILDGFYDEVYEDSLLSPYFHNTTKQRVKEKAYSFYRRLFSGDDVYFGDRPRNAHHWMVISDRIFDYRETLLKAHMRQHGLGSEMIDKWAGLEEHFRRDIVKDKARGRMVGGSEGPVEGFDTIELSVGGLCDSCQGEIDSGTVVHYHLRTGEVFCPRCFEKKAC